MSVPVNAQSTTKSTPGVFGENTADGDGVFGHATGAGRGVVGVSDNATGVEGNSTGGAGVVGVSDEADGVVGEAHADHRSGVYGYTLKAGGNGVAGINESSGNGVFGQSVGGTGVHARSKTQFGVYAYSEQDTGVYGKGLKYAGYFEGDVGVTGDIRVKGISFSSLIEQVRQLEAQVAVLLQHTGGSGLPSGLGPVIQASLTPGVGGEVLTVSGRGFTPSESVFITVEESVNGAPNKLDNTLTVPADTQGAIVHTQTVQCGAGQNTTFEITATGNSSHKSATTGASC